MKELLENKSSKKYQEYEIDTIRDFCRMCCDYGDITAIPRQGKYKSRSSYENVDLGPFEGLQGIFVTDCK